jgi:long-subunit fatty acid transport protein
MAFAYLGIDPSLGFVQTYAAQTPFRLPQQVDVGIAVRPTKGLELEFDYCWIDWSASLAEFSLKLRNGTNRNLNRLAGTKNIDFSLPLNWEDQYVLRFGASWAVSDRITLRTGYAYGSEPITPKGAVLTIPAAGFQTVALGGTFRLFEHVGASLALNHAFRSTISVHQSDISRFEAHSKETTSEWTVQAQLEWYFGGAPAPPR